MRDLFIGSRLAYTEPEQLAGQTRRDGTKHKRHDDIKSYGNYLNKVTIDGKEYYVRFTVQRKKAESGLHSSFVSNVEVYNNPATTASGPSSNGGRKLDYDRITDAKLRTYFELAKENAGNIPGRTDIKAEEFGGRGRVELNYATLKDPESMRYLQERMDREGWGEPEKREMLTLLNDVADIVLEMSKRYPRMKDWQEKGITSAKQKSSSYWLTPEEIKELHEDAKRSLEIGRELRRKREAAKQAKK